MATRVRCGMLPGMRKGFSLVELAIVLAVIGLLVGGVMAGRSLITAAEQRTIVAEIKAYDQAIGSFYEQYGSFPGDLPTATAAWGIAAGTGSDATCYAAESFTTSTCNGNGNGWIGDAFSTTAASRNPTTGANYEWPLAWKHLANSGLIGGKFSNTLHLATNSMRPGYSVPSSDAPGGGYSLFRVNSYAGNANTYPVAGMRHILSYGAQLNNAPTIGPVLTPEQAMHIDQKIDNGQPSTGKVVGYCSAALANCFASTSAYNQRNKVVNTVLWYRLGD